MPAPHALYSKMLAERTALRNVLAVLDFYLSRRRHLLAPKTAARNERYRIFAQSMGWSGMSLIECASSATSFSEDLPLLLLLLLLLLSVILMLLRSFITTITVITVPVVSN